MKDNPYKRLPPLERKPDGTLCRMTPVQRKPVSYTHLDIMSATIMKQHNPGLSDPQLRQLVAAHIDDDSFCRYVIQQDINKIALDLREAHKDDFFSVPENNPLEDFLQTAEETASPDSCLLYTSLQNSIWLSMEMLSFLSTDCLA